VEGIFDLNWNNEGKLVSLGEEDLGPLGVVMADKY
jgi:hypothetical protein